MKGKMNKKVPIFVILNFQSTDESLEAKKRRKISTSLQVLSYNNLHFYAADFIIQIQSGNTSL